MSYIIICTSPQPHTSLEELPPINALYHFSCVAGRGPTCDCPNIQTPREKGPGQQQNLRGSSHDHVNHDPNMCNIFLYILYDMCLEPWNLVATWHPCERIQHLDTLSNPQLLSFLPTCSSKWHNKLLDKIFLSTCVTDIFIQGTLHISRHAKTVAFKPLPVRISQCFTSVDGYNRVALIRRDQGKSWHGPDMWLENSWLPSTKGSFKLDSDDCPIEWDKGSIYIYI